MTAKAVLLLCVTLLCVTISIDANAAFSASRSALIAVKKRPTAKNLAAFKRACESGPRLDFEGDAGVAAISNEAGRNGNLNLIRALIYAESHCTDGASREAVLMDLADPVLVKHAGKLIEALALEGDSKKYADLAEHEGESWFAIECTDDHCRKNRKAYFSQKRKALEGAKIKPAHETIRKMLLDGLKSDR